MSLSRRESGPRGPARPDCLTMLHREAPARSQNSRNKEEDTVLSARCWTLESWGAVGAPEQQRPQLGTNPTPQRCLVGAPEAGRVLRISWVVGDRLPGGGLAPEAVTHLPQKGVWKSVGDRSSGVLGSREGQGPYEKPSHPGRVR